MRRKLGSGSDRFTAGSCVNFKGGINLTMLEIHNLSKYYNGLKGIIRALEDVTIQIRDGEFVAVQGPSGCGKTTLLLAAGGLLAPTEGRIVMNEEHDPYRMSPDERARFRAANIGFVFQQFHLIPYLTVLENVVAPSLALPKPERFDQLETRKRAIDLIARFNMNDRIDHVPAELSTGERQRTALARALLNNPKLLLADEPTGNLDEENAGTVLAAFSEFARSGGAVLLVTHDNTIAGLADRVLHMKNGKIQGV